MLPTVRSARSPMLRVVPMILFTINESNSVQLLCKSSKSGQERAVAPASPRAVPVRASSCSWWITAAEECGETVAERAAKFAHRLARPQHPVNHGRHAIPAFGFFHELLASGAGQGVILALAVVLRNTPLGHDPAALLQAQQGGIESALGQLQQVFRALLDANGEPEALPGPHRIV